MWDDLPDKYRSRRHRPVAVYDHEGLGNFNADWLVEGSNEAHALGPGAQQANTPRNLLAEFGADATRTHCTFGSKTLNDPQARIADMGRMDHYLPLDRGAHPFGLGMPNACDLPRSRFAIM